MNKEKIDIDRGDKDIVFVTPELDMEEVSGKEDPRKFLEEEMKEEGLEWEKAQIIGLFQDEFSLILNEDGEVLLEDEVVYPR